jgi:hypothetical protein
VAKLLISNIENNFKFGRAKTSIYRQFSHCPNSKLFSIFGIILILLFLSNLSHANSLEQECPEQWALLPVVDHHRIRPLEASMRSWLKEVYHQEAFLDEHRMLLNLGQGSAREFFWNIPMLEEQTLQQLPLFWIDDSLKNFLELDTQVNRFSLLDLKEIFEDSPQSNLKIVEQLILDAFFKISGQGPLIPGKKILLHIINAEIECLLAEKKILVTHAPSLVPWHYLSALCLSSSYAIGLPTITVPKSWEDKLHSLLHHFLQYKELIKSKSVINTLFVSPFLSIEKLFALHAYILSAAFRSFPPSKMVEVIAQFFSEYEGILKDQAGRFPTVRQLKAENDLTRFHLWPALTILYCLGTILFTWNHFLRVDQSCFAILSVLSWCVLGAAFSLHSYVLLLKMSTFSSPTTSTFFDSTLFATWLWVLFGFFIWLFFRKKNLLFSSICGSAGFFILFSIFNTQAIPLIVDFLENEIRFWMHQASLILAFLLLSLSGILAHFALILNKAFGRFPHVCLHLGTLSLVLGILTSDLWSQAGGAKIFEWGTAESWVLLALCYYSLLIYLNNYQTFQKGIFVAGICAGMVLLSWGWSRYPCLFKMEFKYNLDLLFQSFACFEIVFLIITGIRKKILAAHISRG